MSGIRRMLSKLFLQKRKFDIRYVSLRSQPQIFSHSRETCVTPKGCFPVEVGKDRKRFSVGISYLNHPLIRALLERSGEEFGMDQTGVLTIPCDVESFEHVLWLVHSDHKPFSETLEEVGKSIPRK